MKEELTIEPLAETPLGLATLRADIITLDLATRFAGFSPETLAICSASPLVKNLKELAAQQEKDFQSLL